MKRLLNRKRENGAITVMAAFVLIGVLAFTALAVDFGLYYYKGAKLQNATDAAATAVAGNLGTIDSSLEEIAYEYLKDNGFDKDKYGKDSNGKNNLQVMIEKKGEVNLESADDERYINTGYYKVTVSTNESTIFGNILDIDSMKLTKTSFVKADANYVAMPRALNYTIFAGSTKGTNSNPAMRVDGRTNKIFNMATYFVERGINIINSSVVQPLIGFFGGTPNYGDLVAINLSEIVSNGDVHSNSNIGVGVQALNVSRMKDRDFEGANNIEAYAEVELEEGEYETGFSDYGQVTFTAVKDIRFNYLNNYADGQTRVYIQNQQYIEQTQAAMNVLDLISDFDSINSTAALQSKYQEAAEIYVEKTFGLTNEQKAAIIAQKDNLEFMSRGNFKLKSQGSIVYYIHASAANTYLDYAEDKGVDGLVADLENDNNDKMFKGDPENSSNGTLFNTAVDKAETTATSYNFTKKNADNTVSQNMKLNVAGNSVSRNINNLSSIPANTLTGTRYATAQTFQENSEYIEIPNLKPYFSRQVNRSIRNATKSRELINQSDAGQKNVKAAVAAKNTELLGLVRNLSFEDNTYANSDEYDDFDKTVLFKTFKAKPNSGITNLTDSVISYNGICKDTDGSHPTYNYTITMSNKTYKGYSLYDANNNLKKPSEFVAEKKTMFSSVKRYGANAITDKRNAILDTAHNGSNNEKAVVDTKKSEIKNNNNYSYNYEKNSNSNSNDVKDRIERPQFPTITNTELVVPGASGRITATLPDPKGVFLVKNDSSYTPTQTYNSNTTEFTNGINYYFPTLNTSAGTVTMHDGCSWAGGSGNPTVIRGNYSDNSNYEVGQNGRQYHIGNITLDRGTLWQGYPARDLKIGEGSSGATLVVSGNVQINYGWLYVGSNSTLYVDGNINVANKVLIRSGGKIVCKGTFQCKEMDCAGNSTLIANSITINDQGDSKDLYIASTTISYNGFACYDRLILNSDNVFKVNGNVVIDGDNGYKSLQNYGKMYVGGNITAKMCVEMLGDYQSCAYICGNVVSTTDNGNDKARDMLHIKYGSKIYIGGQVTSDAYSSKDRRIWIEEGSTSDNSAVLSIYGNGNSEATYGMNLIDFSQDNANVYIGPGGFSTKSGSSENFTNDGNLYCYGNATINTSSNINLNNTKLTYIKGNLTATNATVNINGGHVLFATGTIRVKNMNLNDSAKVHADVAVVVTGTLNLNGASTIAEGDEGGVTYGTLGTNNGTISPPLTFEGSKIEFTGIEEYLYTPSGGTATYSSFYLNRCVVKINGDLVVNGKLKLEGIETDHCILYVTGNISCRGLELQDAELYCEGDISCNGNASAYWHCLVLARNGNDVNTVWTGNPFVSDFTVTGKLDVSESCNVFVEGIITSKAIWCNNGSQVLGYKAVNLTANYITSGDSYESGYFITGGNSEIFCGEQSTTGNEIGILGTGTLFYPNSSLICKHFNVGSGGKVIIDGTECSQNLLVKEYALVDTNGTFVNFGYTKVEGCRFTNRGMMYLVGGENIDAANGSNDNEDFIFGDNAVSYLGRTASGSTLSTLNYKGFYMGRGQVYIENNLYVPGYTSSSSYQVGNRYTGIYVENGNTYVKGGVTVADGNGIFVQYNSGLIMNNNFTIGCSIYNYGRLHVIDGNLVLHNDAMYITDKDLHEYTLGIAGKEKWEKNYEGISLKNGNDTEGVAIPADFYVGGTSPITFIGIVKNFGNIYINSALDVRGYTSSDDVSDDCAFINFCGAQTHINGSVKLNGNQLYNKWKVGDRDAVFACEGNLTYGACLYNCGKLYSNGNITNHETSSNSFRDPVYRNDRHFSVMNGFFKIDDDVRDHMPDYTHFDAELYCDGNLLVGDQEDDGDNYGKAGSVINGGKMFVKNNFTIWTNGTRYQGDGAAFWKNAAPAYFRTGLWLFNNSDTFVGGDTFVGAGCAVARDTIFMTGGTLRTKRATKLNVEMRVDWFLGLGSYMTYSDDHTAVGSDNQYTSSYIYIGGDALINTLGSTVISRTWATLVGAGRWPANNSRDTDIYANTNMYVGGSLYCSSKIYMKENVNIMVAGKDSVTVNGTNQKLGFFQTNGSLKTVLYNNSEGVPSDVNTRARTALYLNKDVNKNCKFFAYQHLDMYPCSKLIVKGGGHVDDTVKIRDMTKTYFYGNFEGKEYVELGKALDGQDETEAKESGFIQAGDSVANYEFSNAPYMYVGGDFESGDQNGVTGVFQWIKNQFASTGYTKVFASATLKVKGTVISNRYITLRHDARIFAGNDLTAATSIEGGNYSEFYIGGDMTAGSSGFTKIIDTLDILDISSRGTIDLREQCQCIVGGNMFSTKHIQIGELAQGSYTRGRKTNYAVKAVTEGDENAYESPDDEDTTETMCPECGEVLTDDEIANRHCDDCNKDIDINAASDGDGTAEPISDAVTLDTTTYLDETDDEAYGANVFIQGTMIALNGHIKEFTYSSVMVGKYVFAPDYVTIRSNADLWIMPEMFGNETYTYLPYKGATPTNLWQRIAEWFKEKAYEFNETYKPKEGSIYTLGDLTLNKNASLMGTYDCYIPGKMIMRADSLTYFGHDVSCYASTTVSALGGAVGNLKNLFTGSNERHTYTGFDSVGEAGKGWRYTCKSKDSRHHGYWYNMTTRKDEEITGTLVCDVCGQPIDMSTKKEVQVSYPAVIYAFNDINIQTTVDMQMTYLVADHGNVNLTNVYTATNWNETNLKELPNAIASYQGNINYFAMYGKLASLFYAPNNNIDFDGYYSEIWGCVLGDTVKMNCYYQAFHRFNNWRTMDLRIAESGSVYIIPEKEYVDAADNVDDDTYIENGVETPAHLFFNKKCPHCLKENIDKNRDNVCDDCGYYLVCPYCHAAAKDLNNDDVCDKCGEGILLPTPDFGLN